MTGTSSGTGSHRDPERGSIVVLRAVDTHDLRRRVLRDGRPDAELHWAGDDDPTTVHLGMVVDGSIIAVSTWLAIGPTVGAERATTQLRGMATEPTLAGTGIGRRLLRAGITHAARGGTRSVWANARVSALRFYERNGFTAVGDVFTTTETGLPHRRVEYPISPSDFPLPVSPRIT